MRSLRSISLLLWMMVCLAIIGLACAPGSNQTAMATAPLPAAETFESGQPDMTIENPVAAPTPTTVIATIPKTTMAPPQSATVTTTRPARATPQTGNASQTSSQAAALAAVSRVIDGDTIEVKIGDELHLVRYIGIDTPEKSGPYTTEEPYGQEATNKNKALVEGKSVRLEKDVSETDSLGRWLRYVYVDDLFVNGELVRLGLARAIAYPPDIKNQGLLSTLESEARASGRGLWGLETKAAPAELTLEVVSITAAVQPGDQAALSARTLAGAQCEITVYYKSGASSAKGLGPKTADSQGNVSWTWTVGSKTSPGSWKIVVKATLNGQTVSQTTYFSVG